jgi:hypothetical protein
MFTLFGILSPAPSRPVASQEAPFKRAFFGPPPDAAVFAPAEEDALYLAGKQPEPAERRGVRSPFG